MGIQGVLGLVVLVAIAVGIIALWYFLSDLEYGWIGQVSIVAIWLIGWFITGSVIWPLTFLINFLAQFGIGYGTSAQL